MALNREEQHVSYHFVAALKFDLWECQMKIKPVCLYVDSCFRNCIISRSYDGDIREQRFNTNSSLAVLHS